MEMMGVLGIYPDSQGLSIPCLWRLELLGSAIVYDDETAGLITAQHKPTRVERLLRLTRFGDLKYPETTEWPSENARVI